MEFEEWHATGRLYSPRVGVGIAPTSQILNTEAVVESWPIDAGSRAAT